MTARETIDAGKAILGIEFGSTRIKAVLIDQDHNPIAQGSHEWENQFDWTPSGPACRSATATSARMCTCTTTRRL